MSYTCGLCCGVCRICCYSTYQCCCCIEEPLQPTLYELICLGITNSGKTTLLSILLNENTDTIVPTVGFSIKDIQVGNSILKVKELGGGENIRPFWNRYYNRVQAVIFVIDGLCTHVELEETKAELFKALQTRQLRSIPWLILCNKQDLEGASTHEKVVEELQIHNYMSTNQHIMVKSCSKTNRDELFSIFEAFAKSLVAFYNNEVENNEARRV